MMCAIICSRNQPRPAARGHGSRRRQPGQPARACILGSALAQGFEQVSQVADYLLLRCLASTLPGLTQRAGKPYPGR
jgi:hypothetical protein